VVAVDAAVTTVADAAAVVAAADAAATPATTAAHRAAPATWAMPRALARKPRLGACRLLSAVKENANP
jgi:hypothetical protein